ncbi:MAG: hypothetical protein DKINENOH_05065 [bacterium]|nr:hypothetical protein [bacterium]MCK6560826.1 hypothetical protein [bacterium]
MQRAFAHQAHGIENRIASKTLAVGDESLWLLACIHVIEEFHHLSSKVAQIVQTAQVLAQEAFRIKKQAVLHENVSAAAASGQALRQSR